ncbi:hypothetical protein KFE25_012061 [Diacronema lutheri]|uniref:EF-hand domain-containing protein n=1 Tax=Diacronema lutheri TaxID=2081491 RepID=A0A8J5XB77_DIALT|nr:hypothetical protein KFE25_012061 [Diacronema lutheri]|mmetsp:Transcript_7816/g.24724  ORF Transcript_7816/g.24724 Transcript_7816/m.24724 type:complete len:451 (-) Transcript_7816:50-1402(-)
MGAQCSAPPSSSPPLAGDGPASDAEAAKKASSQDDVSVGQCFWESRACRLSTLATMVYCVFIFTAFAHNPTLGSFWCPFSQCEMNQKQHSTHEHINSQMLVFAAVCFFFDIFILTFHATHPVHPKYIITSFRRRVIYTHIVSGIVQVLLGPIIWFIYVQYDMPWTTELLVKILVIWCSLFHVTTACFLARTPFGAVRVMLPAFVIVVAMYCYTLGELWNNNYADLEAPLLHWWLMMHIYVFNRIVFTILANLNLLANVRYTLSILLGTAVCTPPSLGMSMMIFVLGAIIVFNLVYLATHEKEEELKTAKVVSAGADSISTKIPEHFVTPEGAVFAKSLTELGAAHLTDREISGMVFRKLDADNSGVIEIVDLARLLVSWGLPSWAAKDMMAERDDDKSGTIDEDEFFRNFADVWQFAATVVLGNIAGVNDGARAGTLIQVVNGHLVVGGK